MIFMNVVSKVEMCLNRIGLKNELSLCDRTSEININWIAGRAHRPAGAKL